MNRTISALSVIGLMAAAGGQARADVLLTGPDANAGSYSTSALAGVANVGDTVSSGGLDRHHIVGPAGRCERRDTDVARLRLHHHLNAER